MGKVSRLISIVVGIAMIVCGVALLLEPEGSLVVVALVLGIGLMAYGIKKLAYYLTMARYMVESLSILLVGVLALDVGFFAITLIDASRVSVVLYLVGYNALSGIFGIVRGLESKRLGSRWKPRLLHGAINLALAILSLAFMGSEQIILIIFCIGLFYSAAMRIASALKPTEIIYIP